MVRTPCRPAKTVASPRRPCGLINLDPAPIDFSAAPSIFRSDTPRFKRFRQPSQSSPPPKLPSPPPLRSAFHHAEIQELRSQLAQAKTSLHALGESNARLHTKNTQLEAKLKDALVKLHPSSNSSGMGRAFMNADDDRQKLGIRAQRTGGVGSAEDVEDEKDESNDKDEEAGIADDMRRVSLILPAVVRTTAWDVSKVRNLISAQVDCGHDSEQGAIDSCAVSATPSIKSGRQQSPPRRRSSASLSSHTYWKNEPSVSLNHALTQSGRGKRMKLAR